MLVIYACYASYTVTPTQNLHIFATSFISAPTFSILTEKKIAKIFFALFFRSQGSDSHGLIACNLDVTLIDYKVTVLCFLCFHLTVLFYQNFITYCWHTILSTNYCIALTSNTFKKSCPHPDRFPPQYYTTKRQLQTSTTLRAPPCPHPHHPLLLLLPSAPTPPMTQRFQIRRL
jgi:hypothetical protein